MRMSLENFTLSGITKVEEDYLRNLEIEEERLRAANLAELEKFTLNYIKSDAQYEAEQEMIRKNDLMREQESKNKKVNSITDLDEHLKAEFDEAWALIDMLQRKEKEMWSMGEIVEDRREDLRNYVKRLEEVRLRFPFLDLENRSLKRQKSFVNWDIDGNTGEIDIEGQRERNQLLSRFFLDSKLKFGNVCMKVVAILQIGNDKDYSEGFVQFITNIYNEFLTSPTSCSIKKTEHILPLIEKIIFPEECKAGLKLIHWLLEETTLGAFLTFEEINRYLTSMINHRQAIGMEDLAAFIVETSFKSLNNQFQQLFYNFRSLLKRLKDEIAFKRKPKQLGARLHPLSTSGNLAEVNKKLAAALNHKDARLLSATSQNNTSNKEYTYSRPLISPTKNQSKAAKLLFRITGSSISQEKVRNDDHKHSQSKELSTSVTVKTSNLDKVDDPPQNLSSHGFKVLLSQYYQSIRGRTALFIQ